MDPYRCEDCSHRFVLPQRGQFSASRLTLVTIGVIAVVGTLVLTLLWPRDEPIDTALTLVSDEDSLSQETIAAAEAGDPDAAYRVGKKRLLDATIDKRKGIEAVEWFSRAASSGHTGAMIQLGRMYRSGIGALQNYSLAVEWIRKSADAGDAEGMLELGRLYRDGIGMSADPLKAYVWFNRAAARLNMDAARERESVARRLSAEQLAEAQFISTHDGVDELPEGGSITQ